MIANTATKSPYLLEGVLWHETCGQPMHPAAVADRGRAYNCGRDCGALLPAATAEQDMLLGAQIRAFVALRQIGRRPRADELAPPGEASALLLGEQPAIGAAERRAWQNVNPADRAAMIHTAYRRVTMRVDGTLARTWRDHEGDTR